MTTKTTFFKKTLALLVAVTVFIAAVPMIAMGAQASVPYYELTADPSTMDGWKTYFMPEKLSTANAGGVWTDKSVFTDASAFSAVNGVEMTEEGENFLVALSAIAANKEIVGYSTIPTDTVLVLDLSNSMGGHEDDLIVSANVAIQKLLDINKNNRVGVVLYSTTAMQLLPIGSYTTSTDRVNIGTWRNPEYVDVPNYLQWENNNDVSIHDDVRDANNRKVADYTSAKDFSGGTYIQDGLWEALDMFEEQDTVIADDNWQGGQKRKPILVLMSDGAPSYGTTNFASVGGSNVGTGGAGSITESMGFLTQLTASYVKNRIEAHYGQQGESLFYTLGFNMDGIAAGTQRNTARSVLDPANSTSSINAAWNAYLTNNSVEITAYNSNGNQRNYNIAKNAYATNQMYVNEYFESDEDSLFAAFDDIVNEILIQSRYYPTHLEGGTPDFSGYVTFTDIIGEYMEVKGIKGILLGNTLFSGAAMASKLNDHTDDGLGTVENPTALGDEFIRAVKTRLGITSTADAQALVARAFEHGQLAYDAATGAYSNYIGWYAKADGTFAGFWHEGVTTAPADAVYVNKSYGFLGETDGSIADSDMMYMSVQVHTNIRTGVQQMLWKVPAALVPMVTYLVTLDGTNIANAQNAQLTVEDENVSPIRLLYEVGLKDTVNELTVASITDAKHLSADGVTRRFWSNYFDISSPDHEHHVTTTAEFLPSEENERFYYTTPSVVYKKSGDSYVKVAEGELVAGGEYYHRRYIFEENNPSPVFLYEKLSATTLDLVIANGWNASYQVSQTDTGAYVVPAGTVARELTPYSEEKADDGAATQSAHMIFYPYVAVHNEMAYVDMNLGNNGLLEVTPAQGLKLTKTLDIEEPGASKDFTFRVTVKNADGTAFSGTLDSWTVAIDEIPTADATPLRVNGSVDIPLSADETFYLTGLPTGATYTVEEISDNEAYRVLSVHVNGQSMGKIARGFVNAYELDNVHFVNTPIAEGDLIISKSVVDENGARVDIADSVKFTAEVTLTNAVTAVAGTYATTTAAGNGTVTVGADGKFTVTLAEGEAISIHGLPEGTTYTVAEKAIPQGFAFDAAASEVSGEILADGNVVARIVNTYKPVATDGSGVNVTISKQISGIRTDWNPGESYTFVINEAASNVRATGREIARVTISDTTAKSVLYSLSGEHYAAAGSYIYTVTELAGAAGNGVTYDTAERRFQVVVADADMNGTLEIVNVTNIANTTVTGTYMVDVSFDNVYAPITGDEVTIPVVKTMAVAGTYPLDGFRFGLYADATDTDPLYVSTYTDASGNASFTLRYPASEVGKTFNYVLKEINTGISNIDYDPNTYDVTVTVADNKDGSVTATAAVTKNGAAATAAFVNTYVPSASADVILHGEKVIDGDRVQNAGEFTFELWQGAVKISEAKNNADGTFSFAKLTFNTPGDYFYTVKEADGNIGGFTYDGAEYEVKITVTDDGNRNLVAATAITKGGVAAPIVFTNTYDATDAEVQFTATKLLTGKELVDGDFTFELKGADGATLQVKPNVGAAITFDKIIYDKVGTYAYTITEIDGGDSRIDYDQSVYAITVTVTDDGEGTLTAKTEMTKNGLPSNAIVFHNGFTPTPITITFVGEKTLEGRPLKDGEFSFKLENMAGGVAPVIVQNKADGSFAFPAVTLPDAGDYHFHISEVDGDEAGITYDSSVYEIRFTVTKDAAGYLAIDQSTAVADRYYHVIEDVGGVPTSVLKHEKATKFAFKNTYRADPAEIVIAGTKVIEGKSLEDKEFTFKLYEAVLGTDGKYTAGKELDSTQNAANGEFRFDTLTLDEAGTYYYVIREDASEAKEGITYDTAEYLAKVVLTDLLDGTMKIEVTYTVDDKAAESIRFSNVFTDTFKKKVFLSTKPEVNIDGENVAYGDILTYVIEYTNGYDTAHADVTIIDTIPAGTELVEGTATEGAVYDAENGTLTWKKTVPAKTTWTVKFDVKVVEGGEDITNAARAFYGDNEYVTNEVITSTDEKNPEPEPPVESPQTGDSGNLALWIALLFVSGGVFFGTMKKKEKEQA